MVGLGSGLGDGARALERLLATMPDVPAQGGAPAAEEDPAPVSVSQLVEPAPAPHPEDVPPVPEPAPVPEPTAPAPVDPPPPDPEPDPAPEPTTRRQRRQEAAVAASTPTLEMGQLVAITIEDQQYPALLVERVVEPFAVDGGKTEEVWTVSAHLPARHGGVQLIERWGFVDGKG